MSISQSTPASSQIIWLEGMVNQLKAKNGWLQMTLADTEALKAGTAERCRMWRDSHIMSQAKVAEQSKRIKELEAQIEKNNLLLDEADAEIETLEAALEAKITICGDAEIIKYKALCDQIGDALLIARMGLAYHINDVDLAIESWREMK